jgi:hypothetical protein
MPERPRPPAAALATWLALVADAIALAWLFCSRQPLVFKGVAGGVDILGVYTILIFYLGRRWEWFRLVDHLRKADRHRDPTASTSPEPPNPEPPGGGLKIRRASTAQTS